MWTKLNQKIIKTGFLALGAAFALLLLLIGIIGYYITGDAPTDAWNQRWIKPNQSAADNLDDKINVLKHQLEWASEGEWLVLEITDLEATSKIYCLARDGNFSIDMKYPQVYFGDDQMMIFAEVDLIVDVQVASEAYVDVEGGMPDVTVSNLHLGRIPVPKTLINTVMTALEHGVEERWESLNVSLVDITIEEGKMLITMRKE
jgi:hypothetical protein